MIGEDDGATVQIVSGLNAGDQVIQDPPDSLIEGEKVTVVNRAAQPHPACGRPVAMPSAARRSVSTCQIASTTAALPRAKSAVAFRQREHCRESLPLAARGPSRSALHRLQARRPQLQSPRLQRAAAYKETGASAVVPPPNPAGGAWQPANPSDGMLKGKWWEIYQDPQLNQLRRAHRHQQRAAAPGTGDLSGRARPGGRGARQPLSHALRRRLRRSAKEFRPIEPLVNHGTTTTYNDFTIAGQASWEPDFWGRIRRTVEQARANAQASAADVANVDLSCTPRWRPTTSLCAASIPQIKLLTDTVADLERQLDLTQRRLHGGVATEVDVAQAQTQLETVRAQLVDVGVARAQFEHAIGTIANYNLPDFSIPPSPLDLPLPKVPLGVPRNCSSAGPTSPPPSAWPPPPTRRSASPSAPFIPPSRWARRGGFESTNPGTWIQGPSSLWTLGAQATELLFDAGQRHALTDQARHNYEAQADGYRNTVFQAFEDVEDQLSGLRILEQEVERGAARRRRRAALLRSLQPALQRRRHQLS